MCRYLGEPEVYPWSWSSGSYEVPYVGARNQMASLYMLLTFELTLQFLNLCSYVCPGTYGDQRTACTS